MSPDRATPSLTTTLLLRNYRHSKLSFLLLLLLLLLLRRRGSGSKGASSTFRSESGTYTRLRIPHVCDYPNCGKQFIQQLRPHGSPTCPHWREDSHVRAMWKGTKILVFFPDNSPTFFQHSSSILLPFFYHSSDILPLYFLGTRIACDNLLISDTSGCFNEVMDLNRRICVLPLSHYDSFSLL